MDLRRPSCSPSLVEKLSPSSERPPAVLEFLERWRLTDTFCLSPLLGGRVSAPTVAFSSFSVAAELLRLLLATGLIWMWNFLGSSSSKSESLE